MRNLELLNFPPPRVLNSLLFDFPDRTLARSLARPQSYCRSVADKYIEWEFVLIAIDLVLHRVQAYRHLLFNMKPFSTHSFHVRAACVRDSCGVGLVSARFPCWCKRARSGLKRAVPSCARTCALRVFRLCVVFRHDFAVRRSQTTAARSCFIA